MIELPSPSGESVSGFAQKTGVKTASLDPRLKSQRFRQEREADWRRLERLIGKVEKGGIADLSDEDILAAPVLYRSALSALSVARATSLDRGLIDYLETLCARAYFFVYGSRETLRCLLYTSPSPRDS